jgi:hypothetical protein
MGRVGRTREVLRSSGTSRKERMCRRSSDGRDSKEASDNNDIDVSRPSWSILVMIRWYSDL